MCVSVTGEKGANIINNDPSGQVSKLPPRVHLPAIESGSKDFITVPAQVFFKSVIAKTNALWMELRFLLYGYTIFAVRSTLA